ncbi:hypothetical protein Syncc9902_1939 [Synechococcus sp. CC9902]|uniref:hypothetical protein n=1 Tax=Synechococcus sp. (strain CC9902) TaxID=316279 RepID=UPI00005D4411|nr:hypothetical protein [Synechococcus sp. CC9902]ABB26896.1 hypothetical protein Syncc9902_1939 [Synechococcus sp. CC9902]
MRQIQFGMRVNCFGRSVLNCASSLKSLKNSNCCWSFPAGRIDGLVSWLNNYKSMPSNISELVSRDFESHHIVHEQRKLEIPNIIICDTWSDLVHQKFLINGETIYCNHVELSELGKSKQSSLGRLDLRNKKILFDYFWSLINLGVEAIIMIDFPALHDIRPEMRKRSKQITKYYLELSQINKNFKFVQIPYSDIALKNSLQRHSIKRLNDENPVGDVYHFSDQTVLKMSRKFDNILAETMLELSQNRLKII